MTRRSCVDATNLTQQKWLTQKKKRYEPLTQCLIYQVSEKFLAAVTMRKDKRILLACEGKDLTAFDVLCRWAYDSKS